MTRTAQETLSIIDELTFRNYAHNRMLSPHITPEQWALIYSNVPEMEERYKLASTGNILDVAPQGENDSRSECPHSAVGVLNTEEGVGGTCAGRHGNVDRVEHPNAHTGAETQAAQSDSQILDRHGDDRFADNILRALEGLPQNGDAEEEEAAVEEGALIEASGYNDPATNPRFA